jgi:hypothetical protein
MTRESLILGRTHIFKRESISRNKLWNCASKWSPLGTKAKVGCWFWECSKAQFSCMGLKFYSEFSQIASYEGHEITGEWYTFYGY